MISTPRTRLSVVVVALALSPPLSRPAVLAGQEALPAARQIVDKFVAAIGGEAAFKAVTSMRARGELRIAAQGIRGDLEVYSARPAKALYRVTVPGVGKIEQGYNGTIGWTVSPVTGPELVSGRELAERADDAWFDGPLHHADRLRELTTLAAVEFDGRKSWKVRVVLNSGHEQIEYFDVDTGLLIGSEADQASPQGVVHTVNIIRNYVKFGSLLQATSFVQRALGFEQAMTLTSVEYDNVPASTFEPPVDVKALITR